jgi:hypothetical protein
MASSQPIEAGMMSLPVPMQQFLTRAATKLGGVPYQERDDAFRQICSAARPIDDDPACHGPLREQLFLLGKRSLINRSDEHLRAIVIGALNKVVPIATAQDRRSTVIRRQSTLPGPGRRREAIKPAYW